MGSATTVIRAASDDGQGLVARRRLIELGVAPSAIARRLRSGDLVAVVPGIYRLAARPLTAELRVRAVMLRLGPQAVLAGRWAAWWHRLVPEPPGSAEITVLMPTTGWCPQWPGVLARRRRLSPLDRERRHGLAVTTRARTVLDCSDQPDAESIRDTALQRGTTMTSLMGVADRLSAGHGAPAARALIAPALDGGVSKPERDLLRGLRHAGAADWTAGVHVETGGRRYWLDLANVRVRLAVEVDGWTVHSTSTAFHDDRSRQNDLVRAGWTVLRYTPAHLHGRVPAAVAEIRSVEAELRSQLRTVGGKVSPTDTFPPLPSRPSPSGRTGSVPGGAGRTCLDFDHDRRPG